MKSPTLHTVLILGLSYLTNFGVVKIASLGLPVIVGFVPVIIMWLYLSLLYFKTSCYKEIIIKLSCFFSCYACYKATKLISVDDFRIFPFLTALGILVFMIASLAKHDLKVLNKRK